MDKTEQQALQVAKEVVIKFIEVGRISPNNFAEFFGEIYGSVLATVNGRGEAVPHSAPDKDAA